MMMDEEVEEWERRVVVEVIEVLVDGVDRQLVVDRVGGEDK